MTEKLRRELERLELKEERRANPERREADAEGEERVGRKETEGEEREDLGGKTLEEEEMRVVEEARDAIDTHSLCDSLSLSLTRNLSLCQSPLFVVEV